MGSSSPWLLDPEITFLNHGSFGACPRPVLESQDRWRRRLESEPVAFFLREYEEAMASAMSALAALLGANSSDMVFVPNATTGVNAVLRSLTFEPGDELLTTNHVYNACGNALRFVASRSGAEVKVASIPFPLQSPDAVVEALCSSVTNKTQLALVDHVTSETGLVLPIEKIVRELRDRNVPTLVDGAHAPGMLPVNIGALAPAYYTGNCHKWLCAPKGAGFLWVRPDLQEEIRPLTISHGANSTRADISRFQVEFGWMGTDDPSAYLSVPEAIAFVSSRMDGGLPALQKHNRLLALRARDVLCQTLGVTPPCPNEMIGSLAALPLPDAEPGESAQPMQIDALQEKLFVEHRIEVPIMAWPAPPHRLIRISAHHYNSFDQYVKLAKALASILA